MQKPRIIAAIAAGQAKLAKKHEATVERTLFHLVTRLEEPMPNIKDIFAGDNLKPVGQMTREEAAGIAGIEVVKKNIFPDDGQTDLVHKVKMLDLRPIHIKAVELAMRHFGLLHDKVELGGKLTLVDETADDETLWKRLEELVAKRKKPEPEAA